jgi:hypothetical protein
MRLIDGRIIISDEIQRIHKAILKFKRIKAISDRMRELIEGLWPELVHKLPPKSVRLHDLWAGTENYVSIGRPR